jgi:HPt (histidine-containing phosphotransfer) domain-containing protein
MEQGEFFDREGALGRLGGDEELFGELVQFFLEDTPGLLNLLRSGLQDNDWAPVERAAHGLKGLASNFGATRAVEAARSVERLGRDRNLPAAAEALPALEREIELLQQALMSSRNDARV